MQNERANMWKKRSNQENQGGSAKQQVGESSPVFRDAKVGSFVFSHAYGVGKIARIYRELDYGLIVRYDISSFPFEVAYDLRGMRECETEQTLFWAVSTGAKTVSISEDIARTDEGLKFDDGKQQWFAMPLEILEPLATLFYAGELKYGTFNCLQPFKKHSSRFYNAMMRHIKASQIDPFAIDQEIKEQYGIEVYHLAQVAFNALMRLYHCKKEKDERAEKKENKENSSK